MEHATLGRGARVDHFRAGALSGELAAESATPENAAALELHGLRAAPDVEAAAVSHRLPRGRVRILVAVDLVALAVAAALTYAVADAVAPPAIHAPRWGAAVFAAALVPLWIAVFTAYRLYERESGAIAPASFDEVANVFHALIAGSLLLLVVGQVLARLKGIRIYSPVEATLFISCALVLVPMARGVVRTWLLPNVMRRRRLLIVGAGGGGRLVERKVATHPEYGLEVVGLVDDRPDAERRRAPVADRRRDGEEDRRRCEHMAPLPEARERRRGNRRNRNADRRRSTPSAPLVGAISELTELVDELEIDRVIVASAEVPYEQTLDRLRAVRRPDVHVSIVPSFFEVFASNATIEDLEGMPLVSLPPMRLSRTITALKRTVDVVVAGVLLMFLAPLFAAIAAAIKLDSRGPVFFRQLRSGRAGRTFSIVKFRTMVDGAERDRFALAAENEVSGPLFKIRSDPRITRVGVKLRRWSLDELPQLWNVLRGDMSLVGPRPFVLHEASQISGWAGRRLDITPGMTGLWQVSGRNDIPFDEMVKLDYVYVTNWSLWWDFKILCQTLPVVLARRGAY
jgi:exopolysaccharide biosynthesis polyprenyl glycosylphosphotransferase